MSREIKFRAWDWDAKMYIEPHILHLEGRIVAPTAAGGGGDTCEIELFTGLHDKNGREIYEGDIVRLFTGRQADSEEAGMDPLRWAFVIEFKDACFGYRGANPDLHHEDDVEFKPICRDGEIHLCEPEVIGNIHENKEMMK